MNSYNDVPNNLTSSNEYKFNYLYKNYKSFVIRVCKRHIKNHQIEDAEDIASNVWTQIWLNIDKFNFEHKYLRNYIMRTAVFAAINTQKKVGNKIYFNVDSDNINLDSMIIDGDGEINEYIDILLFKNNINSNFDTYLKTSISTTDEEYEKLIKKLEIILTQEQITIIKLLYFDDYNYREISKLTNNKMKECINIVKESIEIIKNNKSLFI